MVGTSGIDGALQEASEKLKEKVGDDLSPEIVDEQMA